MVLMTGLLDKAQAETTPPVWNALLQTQASLTGSGTFLNFYLSHVRIKGTFAVDVEDTLVIMPEMAGGFTLLDAYALHRFADIQGLSVMAGQFKVAFGDDRYLTPGQLKRVAYAGVDSLVPGGASAKAWDLGVEVRGQIDSLTLQGELIQGAGPNAAADLNNFKDLDARVEWKSPQFTLGLSDYYGRGGQGAGYIYTTAQNWFGAHSRWIAGALDFRMEAIYAPAHMEGYLFQLSDKPLDGFEPLGWYEMHLTNNVVTAQNLGAGFNLWAGDKTRISLDLSFIGLTDILSVNQEILQIETIF